MFDSLYICAFDINWKISAENIQWEYSSSILGITLESYTVIFLQILYIGDEYLKNKLPE